MEFCVIKTPAHCLNVYLAENLSIPVEESYMLRIAIHQSMEKTSSGTMKQVELHMYHRWKDQGV